MTGPVEAAPPGALLRRRDHREPAERRQRVRGGVATDTELAGELAYVAGGVLQVYHYPDYETPDDPIIFYAWTQVPEATAYVLFESDGQLLWQRPVDGAAVFPVHDEPVDATLRAVAADGSDLATVKVPKRYNGAQYIPGQPAQRLVVVPRYPDCQAIVNDDDGLIHIFDHGTRIPTAITPEAFCAGSFGPIPGLLPYDNWELQRVGVSVIRRFTNGEFVPTYTEYEPIVVDGEVVGGRTTSTPVSPDEVRRRIAARK